MRTKSQKSNICVLGAGSWGTSLAVLLAKNGHYVMLWDHKSERAEQVEKKRENTTYLPGIPLPENVTVTNSLEHAVEMCGYIVFVVPSHVLRSVAKQVGSVFVQEKKFVSATKGVENDSLMRMSQVIMEEIPELSAESCCVLSGPSFAAEVSRKLPTAVVAASESESFAREVRDLFISDMFRIYVNTDVTGVELGGSFKNVMAIAAGIVDGVGFGDNAKAALLTRGIVEMTRLGVKLGADPKTFAGLSGMGDLILTCMGKLSRNLHVGRELGKGRRLDDILDGMVNVAEGVKTAESVRQLALRQGVETPIMEKVYNMLFDGLDPKKAALELMTREPKAEG